jgi:hypothetical protein
MAFFGDQKRAHRDHHRPRRSSPNRTTIEMAASSYYGPNEPIKLAAEPRFNRHYRSAQVPDRRDSQNDRLPPGPAVRSAYGAGSYEFSMPSGMTRETYQRFSAAVTICSDCGFRARRDLGESVHSVKPLAFAGRPPAKSLPLVRNSNAALPCNSQNLPCNTQKLSLQHQKRSLLLRSREFLTRPWNN